MLLINTVLLGDHDVKWVGRIIDWIGGSEFRFIRKIKKAPDCKRPGDDHISNEKVPGDMFGLSPKDIKNIQPFNLASKHD